MEKPTGAGESPVDEKGNDLSRIHSISGHEKSGEKTGGPPSKPKYYLMTDSEEYCEGTVKRTPGGE